MKMKIIKVVALFIIFLELLFISRVYSQTPTYTLTVMNDNQLDGKNYEFDIYLLQTGSNSFEYANNSQYFININPAIINGGTITFTLDTGTCQLNTLEQIPYNRVSFDAVNYRLRIAAQSPCGAGNGTIISSTAPGTRLGRFRITNTVVFAAAQSNLKWYNFNSGFYTKVFAYVSSTNTEITDSTKHYININNAPLPVKLLSFNAKVLKNEVELFWSTSSEMNNSGFEVIRSKSSGTGSSDWGKIGFVQGNRNSNQINNYSYKDSNLQAGKYNYRLKQIDFNNNFEYYDLNNVVNIEKPEDYKLSQNYPNPFNPKCKIDYQIPVDGKVILKIYDVIGREVVTLVDEYKKADYYSIEFDGTNLASGIYFYRIIAEKYIETKKLVLLK